jgi:hypothetical protein
VEQKSLGSGKARGEGRWKEVKEEAPKHREEDLAMFFYGTLG